MGRKSSSSESSSRIPPLPPIPHSSSARCPTTAENNPHRQKTRRRSFDAAVELASSEALPRGSSARYSDVLDKKGSSARQSDFVEHSTELSANISGGNSIRSSVSQRVLVPEQQIPRRYGSRGTESDGLGTSQREISEEDARIVYINDPDRTNDSYEYAGNTIRTSKYTVVTFLPRNLFEQFHRVAYIYFLVLLILNQLPWLAVFGRISSILPLAFVLLVTAVKDGYEDWRRHRSDTNENKRTAQVWQEGSYQFKEWRHIKVGEVVRISSNETLPCDVVLLGTSDPSGVAYVQTINLDGESNLKIRYAKQEIVSMMKGGQEPVTGTIRCEKPNRNIYKFHGSFDYDGNKISLGSANIVLRGCELKNTAWAIGVVIYAGQETKVMLNSSGAPSKKSRLEGRMNTEILYLVAFLVVLCLIMATGTGLWLGRHKHELNTLPYYRKRYFYSNPERNKTYNYYGIAGEIGIAMLTGVIIFQIMIPIALYISMELVRLGQAFFMIRDQQMYHKDSNSKFQCRALNINEDLGQIGYVFSDKTGTLTENKMEFRDASVYGKNYSISKLSLDDENEQFFEQFRDAVCVIDGRIIRPKMEVKVHPTLMQVLRQEEITEETKFAYDYFLALAACNTIVPIVQETSEDAVNVVEYQGESPDEQALAYAAAAYGFMLTERTTSYIVIYVQGQKQRFDLLGMHEFDSDRKRMSVILRAPDKSLKLLVKGADSSMLNVLDKTISTNIGSDDGYPSGLVSATKCHLHEYASQGLRTLVLGYKDLSTAEFENWYRKYQAANNAVTGRARKLREIAISMECNLNLLGATGIEDRLQHGVPETIESLRQAGIKVWVLTGDKQETAISIGISCKLIAPDMQQIIINGKDRDDCRRLLQDAKHAYGITKAEEKKGILQKLKSIKFGFGRVKAAPMAQLNSTCTESNAASHEELTPLALIIDGTSLVHILESEFEEELYDLATQCRVVLCCRVAPLQKAGIVALIKKRTTDVTLAIGDGANDVSMIQMADVGIGISGQEGRQAVMAADFAMGQFRFLERLLLVHGHWNYDRMSYMILYNFYRNAVYVFILFWYVLYTGFTATTAITDWSGMLYSIIYTTLPTIIVGIMDQDLGQKTLTQHPSLYKYGQTEKGYNAYLFWLMMLDTLWQSLVIVYVAYLHYNHSAADIWSIGSLWTIAVVITVNLHLAMDISCWTWITHVALWGSILLTWLCLLVLDSFPKLPNYWTLYHVVTWGSYWLNLMLIICLALLPRFVVKAAKQRFHPSDIQIFKEIENLEKKSRDSSVQLAQINAPA